MARPLKYLTSDTTRIYTNPLLDPNTAGVYQRTMNPQAPDSLALGGIGIDSGGQTPQLRDFTQVGPTREGATPDMVWGSLYAANANRPATNAPNANGAVRAPNRASAASTAKAFGSTPAGKIVASAKSYLGVNRYVYGDWDCSKFTQTVALKAGKDISRTTASQMNYFKQKGRWFNIKDAKPGDFIYLSSKASASGRHVGIYIGNGKMIDNSGSGRPIAVRPIAGRNILGVGRV